MYELILEYNAFGFFGLLLFLSKTSFVAATLDLLLSFFMSCLINEFEYLYTLYMSLCLNIHIFIILLSLDFSAFLFYPRLPHFFRQLKYQTVFVAS